ncbi:MAG: hypothetical protein LN415_01830 [Candidatus Thermoplasmatota archaeon]|nr:hypothetical protein [Candidatus Thermoplasmatota archaeon]
MNSTGQLAVTDALIFLLIASLIVSFSLMGMSGHLEISEIHSAADMKDYAEDTFIVLMRSTLDLERCGANHTQAVDRYILLRTSSQDSGESTEPLIECNLLVHELARNLILERYCFLLSSSYINESSGGLTKIVFAPEESDPPSEHFRLSWAYPMIGFGKSGEAIVSLDLWRR